MRTFFTNAFYLLQELAGVGRLASLMFSGCHLMRWFGVISPLKRRKQATLLHCRSESKQKHVRAHFPSKADVTERAEL